MGLKCLGKCDYHCDCEDGSNSCGDVGHSKRTNGVRSRKVDLLRKRTKAPDGITANFMKKLASSLF